MQEIRNEREGREIEKNIEGNARARAVTSLQSRRPAHYAGDGLIACADALSSMMAGYERAGVPPEAAYWAGCALKYVWRAPLKGQAASDLEKAADCVARMRAAMPAEGSQTPQG